MKKVPILEVCSRIEGHESQHKMLREYCRKLNDWKGLLILAEHNGMAPLLRKNLSESNADVPTSVLRSLNLLYKRHQKQALVRLTILEELLQLFQQHQLTPVLIKGSALCMVLYPDPALRPMRDIDILFSKEEADVAQELLQNEGFEQSTMPIPNDHHHLHHYIKP